MISTSAIFNVSVKYQVCGYSAYSAEPRRCRLRNFGLTAISFPLSAIPGRPSTAPLPFSTLISWFRPSFKKSLMSENRNPDEKTCESRSPSKDPIASITASEGLNKGTEKYVRSGALCIGKIFADTCQLSPSWPSYDDVDMYNGPRVYHDRKRQ